ncbi:armadillo-type protein [Cladorrhinum sp. PSN332]|nr:armadillo-type protein [Cladorrhinum sp. PSN332]
MDDYFRAQQNPLGDPQVNATLGLVSPPRNGAGPLLPRRFTAESGRVPTLSTINTIPRAPEPQDFASTAALHKVQLLEKKRQDYERLREHRRRFEAEMHKLDAQQRAEEKELQQMQEDLNARFGGHQSEPTTPPEYREMSSGFPTIFSRPNRYSTSSLTSPQGLFNRSGRSGSLLASPQSGTLPSRFAFDDLPSRSVPGSRRNSDEDEKEEAVRQDPTSHRSTNALNRYSMPVTKTRPYLGDIGLEDSNNTTGFLFGDEDANSETQTTPTAVSKSDAFPALFRSQAYSALTSSAALDLALSQTSGPETSVNGWNSISKHQHRTSMSTVSSTPINGGGASVGSPPSEAGTIGSRPNSIRRSVDAGILLTSENMTTTSESSIVPPPTNHVVASPPKLQQSYSTGDVHTVKQNGTSYGGNANTHAQQHFQNHNASIGRYPVNAMAGRHNRDLSADTGLNNGRDIGGYHSIGSALHGSAPTFGPMHAQQQQQQHGGPSAMHMTVQPPAVAYPFVPPSYNQMNSGVSGYNTYLPGMMQNLSISGPTSSMFPPSQAFTTGYSPQFNPAPASRPHQPVDSQARVIQARRNQDSDVMARFNNMTLDQVRGNVYGMCKDQHGCRFLQKQLESRQREAIRTIWLETNQHVVELMTDPFGNYLCQKLLEFCEEDERTALIQNASTNMVDIALNQHGTRALQKMIENVSSPVQVNLIIEALRHQVVDLIQDLNGNHVIQKCLNKLSTHDSRFIFEAVGEHVVDVGTHRHGCCVLQRCIDHAEGEMKMWLINQITKKALDLVQDPFGNYVVQYIIDLGEQSFTDPIVRAFLGHIATLSKHKFSSNVVEKCLRCAMEPARDDIISEILNSGHMEGLLRDNFGNYVVQTALEYSSQITKQRLVEAIRPLIPQIRSTPYGRRIQAKISAYDSRTSTRNETQFTPTDPTGGQISLRPADSRAVPHSSILSGNSGMNGGGPNGHRFPIHGNMVTAPPMPQRAHQYGNQVAPPPTENGEHFF